jgi:hypothetical protein
VPCPKFLSWPCLRHLRMLELYGPQWSEDDWSRFADCAALRDGLVLWVSVAYPPEDVMERLGSRFEVEYFAS